MTDTNKLNKDADGGLLQPRLVSPCPVCKSNIHGLLIEGDIHADEPFARFYWQCRACGHRGEAVNLMPSIESFYGANVQSPPTGDPGGMNSNKDVLAR